MKKCNACGAQAEDQAKFCPECGLSDFISETQEQIPDTDTTTNATNNTEAIDKNDNGNIIAGIVGAFLFSLIGVALYFVIYQVGVIAGITGLIMFILANFGYGLFAGTKNEASIVRLITTIVATAVMIFVAEYLCVAYELFNVLKEYEVTFFEALRITPEIFKEPEAAAAIAEDLLFAYAFGVATTIGKITSIVKSRKSRKS